MQKLIKVAAAICIASMVISCGENNSKKGKNNEKEVSELQKKENPKFRRPEIPLMMQNDPEQKIRYYAQNFWENYPFSDSAFVAHDATEILFQEYTEALNRITPADAEEAIVKMLEAAEKDAIAYTRFCSLSNKFFDDPNSPYRNEDFYMAVLGQMLKSNRLTEVEKLRPADQLKQANKNRPGMKAADFSYNDMNGKQGRLSSFNSPYTLLFFYEPDCSNCKESAKRLATNPIVNQAIHNGNLKVLAVYSGPEQEEWETTLPHMPVNWIVVHNNKEEVVMKGLYEIKATPTLYVLDKNKTVILKDATEAAILELLDKLIHLS